MFSPDAVCFSLNGIIIFISVHSLFLRIHLQACLANKGFVLWHAFETTLPKSPLLGINLKVIFPPSFPTVLC